VIPILIILIALINNSKTNLAGTIPNTLNYIATENKHNPRKFVIATYELDYKKDKVITLGYILMT
jgi:hypothetical protein